MVPYLGSLCIHLLMLISMSLVIFGGGGSNRPGVWLSCDAPEGIGQEELSESELNGEIASGANDSNASIQSIDVPVELVSQSAHSIETKMQGAVAPSAEVAEGSSPEFVQAAMAASIEGKDDSLGQGIAGGSAGGSGNGGGPGKGKGKNPGEGPGAYFFGTYASGQRFVFVIDTSRSMLEGSRWPTLRRELNRAIQGLSPDQEFYVISFDTMAHPMFNELPPVGKFLHPTPANLERLNRWVGGIEHGADTLPASSLGIALRLDPDAIFLLSDGEIRDSTVQDLRFYNRKKDEKGNVKVAVPIHTVLLHSEIGILPLKLIADENDGVFTPVSRFNEIGRAHV